MKKYRRNIKKHLLDCVNSSPVVLITGARQTGKTTLVREIGEQEQFSYVTFDDLFSQGAADADPVGFVKSAEKPVIFDEVQCAPKIFLPIKKDVDETQQSGRYILTGSANPLVIPNLGDSLAGRMQLIHLWPLSQGELLGIRESFIDRIFSKEPPIFKSSKIDKEALIHLALTGGYPALQKADSERARYNWCNSYLTALIQKDITDLAKIENLRSIPNILQTLAYRVGALLNERDVGRAVGIPLTTLHRYLRLLEHLYITFLLPGWYKNLGKRVVKAPKIYFVDTAINIHLLGFNEERLRENPNMLGHIIENYVILEIIKQLGWNETIATPYHYRTHDGSDEVDLVLESTSGKIVGIEIKTSETISADDFRGLKRLRDESGQNFHQGFVLYTGNKQNSFDHNLFAVPISALWNP
jgi:predicted AAA+ superfamily ATPase